MPNFNEWARFKMHAVSTVIGGFVYAGGDVLDYQLNHARPFFSSDSLEKIAPLARTIEFDMLGGQTWIVNVGGTLGIIGLANAGLSLLEVGAKSLDMPDAAKLFHALQYVAPLFVATLLTRDEIRDIVHPLFIDNPYIDIAATWLTTSAAIGLLAFSDIRNRQVRSH